MLMRTIWVAHPPASANCGTMSAVEPPMVPADGALGMDPAVSVIKGTPEAGALRATGRVLKIDSENRSPVTPKGEALCMRRLPRNPLAITSEPNN